MSDNKNTEAAKPVNAVGKSVKDGTVLYGASDGKLTEKAPKSSPHKRGSLDGKTAKPVPDK